ncbi:Uncharacterised protein [Fusobacterium necrophorum subsp. necrophorum]|nr:Uncharacterised protein [Fusobacterium necrophorum subsp. necrophorum]
MKIQFFDRKSAKKKPEEIVKHLVGFANASGGILVVEWRIMGELTGFQYIGAHSIEEFKTAPIKLLRDTPIMFEVIEVPIENCRNQKDTVLVLILNLLRNRLSFVMIGKCIYESG